MKSQPDLPVHVKQQLLEISQKLPENVRSNFLREARGRILELALDHPNTVVFTAAGWILGELIDNLLTVPVPFSEFVLELTADQASNIGGLLGFSYGFFKDQKRDNLRAQIHSVIAEELQRALA